jgi:hypothetical protein
LVPATTAAAAAAAAVLVEADEYELTKRDEDDEVLDEGRGIVSTDVPSLL